VLITMVEGSVAPDRQEVFRATWTHVTEGELPPGFVRTFLLRSGESWRIETVWESREALDAMRATTDTPASISVFRAAGVEPSVAVWDVEDHIDPSR
jgi:heme-degrading monooxygenase HmoA